MQLHASGFAEGQEIPRRFTCDGENVSPALRWSGAPSDTRSFTLLCDDPDAPAGLWRHWAVYDIPATQTGLTEGVAPNTGDFKQGVNDFGRRGYGGPCPPHGHGVHHYRFRLLALAAPTLGLRDGARCAEIERSASRQALAEAVLTGVYQR